MSENNNIIDDDNQITTSIKQIKNHIKQLKPYAIKLTSFKYNKVESVRNIDDNNEPKELGIVRKYKKIIKTMFTISNANKVEDSKKKIITEEPNNKIENNDKLDEEKSKQTNLEYENAQKKVNRKYSTKSKITSNLVLGVYQTLHNIPFNDENIHEYEIIDAIFDPGYEEFYIVIKYDEYLSYLCKFNKNIDKTYFKLNSVCYEFQYIPYHIYQKNNLFLFTEKNLEQEKLYIHIFKKNDKQQFKFCKTFKLWKKEKLLFINFTSTFLILYTNNNFMYFYDRNTYDLVKNFHFDNLIYLKFKKKLNSLILINKSKEIYIYKLDYLDNKDNNIFHLESVDIKNNKLFKNKNKIIYSKYNDYIYIINLTQTSLNFLKLTEKSFTKRNIIYHKKNLWYIIKNNNIYLYKDENIQFFEADAEKLKDKYGHLTTYLNLGPIKDQNDRKKNFFNNKRKFDYKYITETLSKIIYLEKNNIYIENKKTGKIETYILVRDDKIIYIKRRETQFTKKCNILINFDLQNKLLIYNIDTEKEINNINYNNNLHYLKEYGLLIYGKDLKYYFVPDSVFEDDIDGIIHCNKEFIFYNKIINNNHIKNIEDLNNNNNVNDNNNDNNKNDNINNENDKNDNTNNDSINDLTKSKKKFKKKNTKSKITKKSTKSKITKKKFNKNNTKINNIFGALYDVEKKTFKYYKNKILKIKSYEEYIILYFYECIQIINKQQYNFIFGKFIKYNINKNLIHLVYDNYHLIFDNQFIYKYTIFNKDLEVLFNKDQDYIIKEYLLIEKIKGDYKFKLFETKKNYLYETIGFEFIESNISGTYFLINKRSKRVIVKQEIKDMSKDIAGVIDNQYYYITNKIYDFIYNHPINYYKEKIDLDKELLKNSLVFYNFDNFDNIINENQIKYLKILYYNDNLVLVSESKIQIYSLKNEILKGEIKDLKLQKFDLEISSLVNDNLILYDKLNMRYVLIIHLDNINNCKHIRLDKKFTKIFSINSYIFLIFIKNIHIYNVDNDLEVDVPEEYIDIDDIKFYKNKFIIKKDSNYKIFNTNFELISSNYFSNRQQLYFEDNEYFVFIHQNYTSKVYKKNILNSNEYISYKSGDFNSIIYTFIKNLTINKNTSNKKYHNHDDVKDFKIMASYIFILFKNGEMYSLNNFEVIDKKTKVDEIRTLYKNKNGYLIIWYKNKTEIIIIDYYYSKIYDYKFKLFNYKEHNIYIFIIFENCLIVTNSYLKEIIKIDNCDKFDLYNNELLIFEDVNNHKHIYLNNEFKLSFSKKINFLDVLKNLFLIIEFEDKSIIFYNYITFEIIFSLKNYSKHFFLKNNNNDLIINYENNTSIYYENFFNYKEIKEIYDIQKNFKVYINTENKIILKYWEIPINMDKVNNMIVPLSYNFYKNTLWINSAEKVIIFSLKGMLIKDEEELEIKIEIPKTLKNKDFNNNYKEYKEKFNNKTIKFCHSEIKKLGRYFIINYKDNWKFIFYIISDEKKILLDIRKFVIENLVGEFLTLYSFKNKKSYIYLGIKHAKFKNNSDDIKFNNFNGYLIVIKESKKIDIYDKNLKSILNKDNTKITKSNYNYILFSNYIYFKKQKFLLKFKQKNKNVNDMGLASNLSMSENQDKSESEMIKVDDYNYEFLKLNNTHLFYIHENRLIIFDRFDNFNICFNEELFEKNITKFTLTPKKIILVSKEKTKIYYFPMDKIIVKMKYCMNLILLNILKNLEKFNCTNNSKDLILKNDEKFINNWFTILKNQCLDFHNPNTENLVVFILINLPLVLMISELNIGIVNSLFRVFKYSNNLYNEYKLHKPLHVAIQLKKKIFVDFFIEHINELKKIKDIYLDFREFLDIFELYKYDYVGFKNVLKMVFKKSKFNNDDDINNYLKSKRKLIIKSNKTYILDTNFLDKFKDKNENEKEYNMKNFVFKLNFDYENIYRFLTIYYDSSNEIKLSAVKYILLYFYKKITFIKYLYWTFFFLMISLLLFKIVYYNENFIMYISLICLTSILILYELFQMIKQNTEYFKDVINYIDIVVWFYNLVIINLTHFEKIPKFDIYLIILIYLNLFRFIILLKTIKYIRKQVILFLKVLKNSIDFLAFIFIILGYLTVINLILSTNDKNNIDKLYIIGFSNVYNMMLGNWSDRFIDFAYIHYIEFFVNTIIFTIILLNLYISLVSDIYGSYVNNQELYDLKEINSLLFEFTPFFYFFKKKSFYVFVFSVVKKSKDIAKQFKLINKNVDRRYKKLKKEILEIKNLLKKALIN